MEDTAGVSFRWNTVYVPGQSSFTCFLMLLLSFCGIDAASGEHPTRSRPLCNGDPNCSITRPKCEQQDPRDASQRLGSLRALQYGP